MRSPPCSFSTTGRTGRGELTREELQELAEALNGRPTSGRKKPVARLRPLKRTACAALRTSAC